MKEMAQHLQPPKTDHTYRHHTSPRPHHTSVTTTDHPVTTYTPTGPPTNSRHTFRHRNNGPHGLAPHIATTHPYHPLRLPPQNHSNTSLPLPCRHKTTITTSEPPNNVRHHHKTTPMHVASVGSLLTSSLN